MKTSIWMLAAVLLISAPALAKDKHGGYFGPGDVRILREYYEPRHRGLPPGLQKKLLRTGRVPPGWEKKLRPFPLLVERRLVELPPYYRRGIYDDYAVVYDPRTHIIIDIAIVGR